MLLALPREIRDKMYEILLCDFRLPPPEEKRFAHVPDTVIYLEHDHLQPQILRVNRQTHDEAIHVMLRKNLFVKVTTIYSPDLVERTIGIKQLPILNLAPRDIRSFKGHVMEHITSDLQALRDSAWPWEFIFLHRDMHLFCQVIEYLKGIFPDYDQRLEQQVTLVDPYPKAFLPQPNSDWWWQKESPNDEAMWKPQSFYSEWLQGELVAPYRALKGSGLPFTISAVPDLDPNMVIAELAQSKLDGNEHYRLGDGSKASEAWNLGIMKTRLQLCGKGGEDLRSKGGLDFINRIMELNFDLNSNMAQNALREMKKNRKNMKEMRGLAASLFRAVSRAQRLRDDEFPEATWQPSPKQNAKLFYRYACASRLIGAREVVRSVMDAISDAQELLPGDPAIEEEVVKIAQWARFVGEGG